MVDRLPGASLPTSRRHFARIVQPKGSFADRERQAQLPAGLQEAIASCVEEGVKKALPDRSADWVRAPKPRNHETWVPNDLGEFVRLEQPEPQVDPLAEFRRKVRTVLSETDTQRVVEYRDGWGNYERAVEWLASVTPPKGEWEKPMPKPPRPTIPRSALGKIASSVSTHKKNATWLLACRARPWQRDRTRKCRIHRIGHQSVQVRSDGKAVSVCGVETCASVWGCPICAQAIYAERATEVTTATKAWRALGPTHVVVMVTTTIRHQRCDDLKGLRKGLANAWRAMWGGRRAKLLKAELGIVHHVRALEVNDGSNGWHPHLHTLCFLKLRTPEGSDESVWSDELVAELRNRWIDSVDRVLGASALPNWEHGLDVRISRKDDYIAKLGLEIASIVGKQGRLRGHRTPWQLLSAATDGNTYAQDRWRHYATAMLGARQLTWSKGAKRAFGIREKTDEEIAKQREEEESRGIVGFNIAGWLWDSLIRVPAWLPAFIHAVKEDPRAAAAMLPPAEPDMERRSWYQFDRGG